MQMIRKYGDVLAFAAFILALLVIGLAMNTFDVRAALAADSLMPIKNTSFTYQGFLEDEDGPINATCDFRFTLYDANSGGSTVGPANEAVLPVDRGVFSTKLDFGNVFYVAPNWLSVALRCPSGSGSYTTLTPRTEITGTPMANTLPGVDVREKWPGSRRGITDRTSFWENILEVYGEIWAGDIDARGEIRAHQGVEVGDRNGARLRLYPTSTGPFIKILDGDDYPKVDVGMHATNGTGYMETLGPYGRRNIGLGQSSAGPGYGWLGVSDGLGSTRTSMYVGGNGNGIVYVGGANGNDNVVLSAYSDDYPNHGWMGVRDASGTNQAGMYVDTAGLGRVFADVKNFRVANPNDPGTEIWYAALEGPEAAAYVRGTAKLVNGKANVALPDHFQVVASEQGMTVQVTPLSAQSSGLAVVEKGLESFQVQELQGGSGTYEFDFTVTAVRKGFEDYEVIQPAAGEPMSRETAAVTNSSGEVVEAASEENK